MIHRKLKQMKMRQPVMVKSSGHKGFLKNCILSLKKTKKKEEEKENEAVVSSRKNKKLSKQRKVIIVYSLVRLWTVFT